MILKKAPVLALLVLLLGIFFWAKLAILYIHPIRVQGTALLPDHQILIVWKPANFGPVFHNVSHELGNFLPQLMQYMVNQLLDASLRSELLFTDDMGEMESKWYLKPEYWYHHKDMLFGILF